MESVFPFKIFPLFSKISFSKNFWENMEKFKEKFENAFLKIVYGFLLKFVSDSLIDDPIFNRDKLNALDEKQCEESVTI